MMGCYGDKYAKTPNFDQLAAEGILYTRAYSVAPVCSVSRSSIVSGMYPSSIGTMHHRSNVGNPPAFVEMIPNRMRKAGYWASNWKGDFNIRGMTYDQQGKAKAHWRNRPDKSQPFFSKFDFGECHSSVTKTAEDVIVEKRLNRLQPGDFRDPAKAPIPPYHPNDAAFRKAWSRYYDSVTQVDYRAGEIINQLKEDGLWDDTIVIVWADHGVGMPRGKHTVWEQGTHVPLIVRFPKKYQHLAPAKPGSVLDDLVCLMDMGPSVLKMAGLEPPAYMQGRALLARSDAKKRDYVVAVRNRLDTRTEMVRAIRDHRFRYQRNFYPHLPFKPYETFEFTAPLLEHWVKLARAGKLTGDQELLANRFKPLEELYDSETDPHMVKNLADDPKFAGVLKRMRARLRDWMIETRDLGIVEENELLQRAQGKSLWDVGQELDNYERILETANLQLQGTAALRELKSRSQDPDPLVRYWAVLNLAVITQSANAKTVAGIVPLLQRALADESIDVRLNAADGLFNLGRYQEALPVLIRSMKHPNVDVQIRVGNILDSQPPDANEQLKPAVEPLIEAIKRFKPSGRYGNSNNPFMRAYLALTSQKHYYRWGMGASGSPQSPLMAVQKKPFVEKQLPPLKLRRLPAPRSNQPVPSGKPSALKAIGGKLAEVSSFHQTHPPELMLDGNFRTFWHTRFKPDLAQPPHFVVLQLPGKQAIRGLRYHAWHGPGNGHLKSCSIYVSDDGKTWGKPLVEKATLKPNAKVDQQILFPTPSRKKFIKLEVTDAVSRSGQPLAAIGELDVIAD